MFIAPPTSWAHLVSATEKLDKVGIRPSPAHALLSARLRIAYQNARSTDYQNLSSGAIRKLPYAYWVDDRPSIVALEGTLVSRYWTEFLPDAVRSNPRRARRWLIPLFHTYCEQFAPEDRGFQEFARKFAGVIHEATGAFAATLVRLNDTHGFFTPQIVTGKLALALCDASNSFESVLHANLLWPGFVNTRLGAASFNAALATSRQKAPRSPAFLRLLEWSDRFGCKVSSTAHRVPFAHAMLTPWSTQQPEDSLRRTLVTRFTKDYGDPRDFPEGYGYHWRGVDKTALDVLLKWLTGDTLQAFISILERTADPTWGYRRTFWMAYYQRGYIDQAWLALGARALRIAEQLRRETSGAGFGRLEGAVEQNHSVLLLKIGHLTFSEWSHHGSLRAFTEDNADAPALYHKIYNSRDLRSAQSLDFHDGANERAQLMHHHSDRGTWQRKARDFIKRHTGVYLSDTEIL
jgi:hypothetical protein